MSRSKSELEDNSLHAKKRDLNMKGFVRLLLTAFVVGVWLLASIITSNAAEKTFSFRFAHFGSHTAIYTKNAQDWCAEIEKRTAVRVQIKLYLGETLTPITQVWDNVAKGVVDIGYGIFSYHRGRLSIIVSNNNLKGSSRLGC
jgi:TRAP-type transport system periplasmic protein